MKMKHGMSRTATYQVWVDMRWRCRNKNHKLYHRYGGRGIAVCERWDDFLTFFKDMGEKPPGLTLERERNGEGYHPNNCVWATSTEQNRNRSINRLVTHNGETKCLAEWCEILQLNYNTVESRLRKLNWPPLEALEIEAHARRNNKRSVENSVPSVCQPQA